MFLKHSFCHLQLAKNKWKKGYIKIARNTRKVVSQATFYFVTKTRKNNSS